MTVNEYKQKKKNSNEFINDNKRIIDSLKSKIKKDIIKYKK